MSGPLLHRRERAGVAGALAILGLLAAACAPRTEQPPDDPLAETEAERLLVVTTLPPLADLARRVGGERVEVEFLVPPGMSPHTFSLRPSDARRLEEARVILMVGHPALPFEEAILDGARGRSGVEVLPMVDPETPPPENPHVWLAPARMAELASELGALLGTLDPTATEGYAERAEVFRTEVDALRRELLEQVAEAPGRTFLVHHPAWAPLAAELDLIEIAVEVEGKEPSPQRLADMMKELRDRGFDRIFTEVTAPSRGAEVLAREIDVEVVALDPIPEDWFEGLREATRELIAGTVP